MDPILTFRSPVELTARIDAWAEDRKLNRAEAIRTIVGERLDADGV